VFHEDAVQYCDVLLGQSISLASQTKHEDDESLTPYSNAIDAVYIILLRLTVNLKSYVQEVLNNARSESLHDFRITIRKSDPF
jgi:hypothetical protein